MVNDMRVAKISAALAAMFILSAVAGMAAEVDTRQIGQGDRLLVRVPTEPAMSGEYTIDETGRFFFPILEHGLDLGGFKVDGLTLEKAEELVISRMSKYYESPVVNMEFVAYGVRPGFAVSIFGAVTEQYAHRFFDGMKLMDALIKSRPLPDADLSKLALFRGTEPVRYIDIRLMMEGKDLSSNILMQAGDMIIVPYTQPAMKMRVIVLGKVTSPGTVFVPEGTQILDLLGRAGGTVGRAAIGNTYVIRVVDGEPVIINSDVKSLMKFGDLKENIVLKDGDVVFVPETSRVDIAKVIQNLSLLNLIKSTTD
ncbi:MAG: Polysaccharide biosynthesis/export protein [bacterium ADurb.Bin236]|nr:MAG: Polysaccharide biosynthesis/export protein [bacterium ADurb.Bin236]